MCQPTKKISTHDVTEQKCNELVVQNVSNDDVFNVINAYVYNVSNDDVSKSKYQYNEREQLVPEVTNESVTLTKAEVGITNVTEENDVVLNLKCKA